MEITSRATVIPAVPSAARAFRQAARRGLIELRNGPLRPTQLAGRQLQIRIQVYPATGGHFSGRARVIYIGRQGASIELSQLIRAGVLCFTTRSGASGAAESAGEIRPMRARRVTQAAA